MPEVKLPEGWVLPFTASITCDRSGEFDVIDDEGRSINCYYENWTKAIAHALNVTYSPDGELARARLKIEALVEAVDLFLEDYPLHECNRPTCAVEMARAAKELP